MFGVDEKAVRQAVLPEIMKVHAKLPGLLGITSIDPAVQPKLAAFLEVMRTDQDFLNANTSLKRMFLKLAGALLGVPISMKAEFVPVCFMALEAIENGALALFIGQENKAMVQNGDIGGYSTQTAVWAIPSLAKVTQFVENLPIVRLLSVFDTFLKAYKPETVETVDPVPPKNDEIEIVRA